jgi:hypothetical protein
MPSIRMNILRGDFEKAADLLIDKSYQYLSHSDANVRDMSLFINSMNKEDILKFLKKQK